MSPKSKKRARYEEQIIACVQALVENWHWELDLIGFVMKPTWPDTEMMSILPYTRTEK